MKLLHIHLLIHLPQKSVEYIIEQIQTKVFVDFEPEIIIATINLNLL